jgi:hypothetical protein
VENGVRGNKRRKSGSGRQQRKADMGIFLNFRKSGVTVAVPGVSPGGNLAVDGLAQLLLIGHGDVKTLIHRYLATDFPPFRKRKNHHSRKRHPPLGGAPTAGHDCRFVEGVPSQHKETAYAKKILVYWHGVFETVMNGALLCGLSANSCVMNFPEPKKPPTGGPAGVFSVVIASAMNS